MKKLYFIRHGESLGNARRVFTGQWDAPLTDLGRAQAKTAAKKAGSLNIDCIVSSTLVRAGETAKIIAAEIGYPLDKIVYSNLFMERNYGDWQQQPYSVADGKDFESVPGVESEEHLLRRAKAAVALLKGIDADNILVVGHGTHGLALLQEISNRHIEQIEVPVEDELPNAQIIELV
ncbi:MAG TPA: histidine phosphatase family protein [Candidatus Binatia bacterium]|nr:histidine phosphatase family protein [Candidatus Binatia bacterium]